MSLLLLLRSPKNPGLVTDGLLAHYDFSEGSGQVLTDLSGNGYHGQLGSTSGADTNDPAWGSGYLTFDGTDDYVGNMTALGVALRDKAGLTITAVVRAYNAASDDYVFGVDSLLDIRINAAEQIRFGLFSGGAYSVLTNTNAVTPGSWYALDCWYDGTDYGIDLNTGSSVSSGKTGNTNSSSSNVRIGTSGGGTGPWADRIAYLLVYDQALATEQRAQNYRHLQKVMAARSITI